MLVIGAFGSLALRAFVLPAQIGEAELMAEVVIIGACGAPLQVAGTPSKAKSAVAVLAVPVELEALPYILPFLPVTVYWFILMPVAEPLCVISITRLPPVYRNGVGRIIPYQLFAVVVTVVVVGPTTVVSPVCHAPVLKVVMVLLPSLIVKFVMV
jgi:hypothetical protein